MSVAFIR